MKLSDIFESVINFPSSDDRVRRLNNNKIQQQDQPQGSVESSTELAQELRDRMVKAAKIQLSPRFFMRYHGLEPHRAVEKMASVLQNDLSVGVMLNRIKHGDHDFDGEEEFQAIIDDQIMHMVERALKFKS